MSSRKKRNPNGLITSGPSQLHRRRSSLPNLKIMPLTMAERRLLARKKRKEAEEAAKLRKKQAEEEKRQRAKALRQQTRAKDRIHARKCTILGTTVHCRYCDDFFEEMDFDEHKVSHPTQIRERIWLGNAENSHNLEDIKKCGITHILNCTREIQLSKKVSKKIKSFKRISIQDKNHETIMDYITDSNAFIEKALGDAPFNVVFVHCREGRSRSVSFLCCYLMWKEKVSFHAVLSDITSKRHIVLPNNKFYKELERLDKELITDRKNDCEKYGKPMEFKVKKLKGNEMTKMNNYLASLVATNNSQFRYPEQYADDVKYQDYPEKRESLISPANDPRRRRSSLTDIALLNFDATSPLGRTSMGIAIPMNGYTKGRLSPVEGSPATKKHRASDPWKEVANATKRKKKGDGTAKKKSSKKKNKLLEEDLEIEQAMDVSDIFGNKHKDKSKRKKKSSKKGSKKKKKNKTNE